LLPRHKHHPNKSCFANGNRGLSNKEPPPCFFIAKEYKEMIDSGEVKNQSELAKLKRIIRARVHKF